MVSACTYVQQEALYDVTWTRIHRGTPRNDHPEKEPRTNQTIENWRTGRTLSLIVAGSRLDDSGPFGLLVLCLDVEVDGRVDDRSKSLGQE